MRLIFPLLLLAILFDSCGSNESREKPAKSAEAAIGSIEIYDPAGAALIDSNAAMDIIGRNYSWAEGPVWVAGKQMLLFSDVRQNKIMQWKEGDTPTLYLTPSGYTNPVKREGGEDGSNGLTLDKDGNLLLCQSGNRQVVRMKAPIDAPKPEYTVLSAGFEGHKFNSPNDLVADRKNNIYFTDPIYGLPKGADDPTREIRFTGVYKIGADGKTSLLIDSIPNPNGIALSPDQKILYVASSDETRPGWFAYQLDEKGNIQRGGLLADATPMKEKATVKQGADGFKVDDAGNIYSSGPDGINILSPSGKLLALIKIYNRPTSNCAFNDRKDVLFITAEDVVIRVKLHAGK